MLSPPTDNLYKFISIFGLAIIFGSASFWWEVSLDIDDHFVEAIDHAAKIREKYIPFADKVNEVLKIYNEVNWDTTKLSNDQKKVIGTKLKNIEPIYLDMEQVSTSASAPLISFQRRIERYEMVKWFCSIGLILGLSLSVVGFMLWYKRLQKFIDESTRNDK